MSVNNISASNVAERALRKHVCVYLHRQLNY